MALLIKFFRQFFFLGAAIVCRIVLKIFWKRVDVLPYKIDKGVLVLAPHTSKWDGVWGIFYTLAYLNYNRTVKMAFRKESDTPILGKFLKFVGAIFIDRHNTEKSGINNLSLFVNQIKKHKRIYIGIFAEGTRNPVKIFNPGFYYIAYRADVPIIPMNFNYGKSSIIVGKPFNPSGSYKKDFHLLEDFYKGTIGKRKENFKIFDKE